MGRSSDQAASAVAAVRGLPIGVGHHRRGQVPRQRQRQAAGRVAAGSLRILRSDEQAHRARARAGQILRSGRALRLSRQRSGTGGVQAVGSAARPAQPVHPGLDGGLAAGHPVAWLDEAWPVQVEVVFADPEPVRPERLIAQGLGLSRNEALRRIKCDIPLRRPMSAGFAFTVMARDQQLTRSNACSTMEKCSTSRSGRP